MNENLPLLDVDSVPPATPAAAGGSESLLDTVARLSALHPLEYEKVREAEAKRLEVRVGALDKEVSIARRTRKEEGGKMAMFPVVEPWHEPVNGEKLLNDLRATIQRFIVCEWETAITAALWIVFTWLIDHVQVAPLAVITAPEKRCGKSQLLNLIGRVSRRPLVASNISSPAMFRVIEAHGPTLLIDEADTFFRENEELRGVINSGHTRQSAYVIRTVGDDHEPRQFSTWGAKAISGIGHLAETMMDRAVILELRRKLPNETVQRLRHAEPHLFDKLASRLARYAEDAGPDIELARPELPEALNDRAQDNWEPLLAVADHVGGDWPRSARLAALKISGSEQEPISLSTELLADIQEVFETGRITRIKTTDLITALTEDEEKGWATYNRGRPLNPKQLANKLRGYGITRRALRFGYDTTKGYELDQFHEAFDRYLSHNPPFLSVTRKQPSIEADSAVADKKMFPVTQETNFVTSNVNGRNVTDDSGNKNTKETLKPAPDNDCFRVTDKSRVSGDDIREELW